jgi:hypothetical protein
METAAVTPPAELPAHVVLKACHVMIGDNMVPLPQNKVITDFRLITACLESGAPVISVDEIGNHISCPQCGNVFKPQPVQVAPGDLSKLRSPRS